MHITLKKRVHNIVFPEKPVDFKPQPGFGREKLIDTRSEPEPEIKRTFTKVIEALA
jgi:hypothetical protein